MSNTEQNTATSLVPVPATPQSLKSLRIKHTRIGQMVSELQTLIYPESQDSILLVCGPSGVGKSTLGRYMVQSSLEQAKEEMHNDAGLIPAVYVEAPASGSEKFSWSLLYERILRQLDGDLRARKHAYGIDPDTGLMVKPKTLGGNKLDDRRTAVENALKQRGTRYLVIDEAAHIIRQTRRNHLEIQLDTLKSLANSSGTQIVLIGAYDLYELMSLSGQIARRTHVLHFERYRMDVVEDRNAFIACIQKFQDILPNIWGKQLVQHAEVLQETALGCIGTLSGILMRAAKLALTQGSWSDDVLRKALLTEAQRKRILKEILEGEEAIDPGLTRELPAISSTSKRVAGKAA